jgi:hypothetical protein
MVFIKKDSFTHHSTTGNIEKIELGKRARRHLLDHLERAKRVSIRRLRRVEKGRPSPLSRIVRVLGVVDVERGRYRLAERVEAA